MTAAIYYLGEDCPKCGSYRVLPAKKDGRIWGHCLKCGHDFPSDKTGPAVEDKPIEVIKMGDETCGDCAKFSTPSWISDKDLGICQEEMFGQCEASDKNEGACEHFKEKK